MPSLMQTALSGARDSSHAREWALVGGVALVGTGIALRHPSALVDPSVCLGLTDLAIITALRTWRDLSVGTIVSAANTITIALAMLLLVRVIHVVQRSALVTVAVGLAAATTPMLAPVWAPTPAVAQAATAACWLIIGRTRSRTIRLASLAMAAAAGPALAWPLAGVAGVLMFHGLSSRPLVLRVTAGIAAAAVIVSMPMLIGIALAGGASGTSMTTCLWPAQMSLNGAFGASRLPMALALLGAWTFLDGRQQHRSRAVGVIAFLAMAFVVSGGPASAAPFVLVFWILCALGLFEAVTALATTPGRRAGGAILSVALVILSVAATPPAEVAIDQQPRGHDVHSRNSFLNHIGTLPDATVLLVEDALTDLLIHAMPSRTRNRRDLHTLQADDPAIVERLQTTRIFALPRAQRQLQSLGFRLVLHQNLDLSLAEVLPGGACSAILTPEWQDVTGLSTATRFAIHAADERSIGPIYLYLTSDVPLSPQAIDWPPAAMRGFHARRFEWQPDAPELLSQDLVLYGAESQHPYLVAPHVTRIEMWRIPKAPLHLQVDLGGSPRRVLGRLAGVDVSDQIRLCPAFQPETAGEGQVVR